MLHWRRGMVEREREREGGRERDPSRENRESNKSVTTE